jgi:amidase
MAGPDAGGPPLGAAARAELPVGVRRGSPAGSGSGRYCDNGLSAGLDPQVREAYDAASALLEELGHDVEDIASPFGPSLVPSFETVWAVSSAGCPVDPAREGELRPLTRWLRERGRSTSAPQFTAAMVRLQQATRAAVTATAAYDVVLTPTLAGLPAPGRAGSGRPATPGRSSTG